MRLAKVVLPLAAAGTVLLVATGSASAHRPGCNFSPNQSAGVGNPRHVYAIPHGCVWLYRPATRRSQPVAITRIHGRTRWHLLGRQPVADAKGVCWLTSFVVRWPYVLVATDGVWYERSGRNECLSDFDAAPVWWMRWRNGALVRVLYSPTRHGG